jgi:hypothetical protein
VLKPSSPENEYNIRLNKNSLASNQINLPIQGIFDFAKFNFSKINNNVDGVVLTPFNLPKKIKLKLHKLCIKQNWNNDDDIFQNLNIPPCEKIKHSPFNYKYVFDYVSAHKTFIYANNLCVDETILLAPVNQNDFKLFYLI